MYFDFEDYRPDITPVGQVISWREGVLLSIIAHMGLIILVLLIPRWFPYDPSQANVVVEARHEDNPRFVIVNPKVDLEALRAPDLAPPSDKNREARSPEPVIKPDNPLPTSRGNSFDRTEQSQPEIARGRGPTPDPSVAQQPDPTPPSTSASADSSVVQPRVPESQSALALPNPAAGQPRRTPGGGALGDALRNLDRYVKNEQFDNSNGAAQFGPFQFDTKGVEFGPWIRRFAAQVQRNWDPLIPNGPIMLRQTGHVVVTLNIHKNGLITDVTVVGPCPIEGFNTAAFGALLASNPTQPLPPEYPAEKAFFTITFYYNERPPDR